MNPRYLNYHHDPDDMAYDLLITLANLCRLISTDYGVSRLEAAAVRLYAAHMAANNPARQALLDQATNAFHQKPSWAYRL